YSLGARSIGRAWIIGGYEGSEAMATYLLNLVPCTEIARAWILAEENGPRQLPMEMLKRYGIDIKYDYAEVGTLKPPRGHCWNESACLVDQKQQLLKPKRSSELAVDACKEHRQGGA